MIAINSYNELSRLGVEMIFDIEKIGNVAYQSGSHTDSSSPRIVMGEDAITHDARMGKVRNINSKIILLKIDDICELLGQHDGKILKRYCKNGILCVPCNDYLVIGDDKQMSVEILLKDSAGNSIIVRKGQTIWSGLDIGESFFLLVTEGYLPERKQPSGGASQFYNNIIQRLYYNSPALLRSWAQRLCYRILESGLKPKRRSHFLTDYPVDITGWLLIRILSSFIRQLDGRVVSVAKWRHPYKGAFVFTHDIEPTKFSYTIGIKTLLERIGERDEKGHTIDLVACYAKRFIDDKERISSIRRYPLMSHGYDHIGGEIYLPYEEIRRRIAIAKGELESLFGKEVSGYRSPRYERNDFIVRAIIEAGHKFSSVYPDIDRGNADMYGAGVTINYPFYHHIKNETTYEKTGLLEIPITSPDCIEPLMMGYDVDAMRSLYHTKIGYMNDIEGAYVCIVHAGNFDNVDVRIRTELLKFLLDEIEHYNFWRTDMDALACWWKKREKLCLKIESGAISITNHGDEEVDGIVLVYETQSGEVHRHVAGRLAPQSVSVIKI